MIDQLKERFQALFGQQQQYIFFSPGRVNLIGEHIDYNGGLVMPCAITFGTFVLVALNNEGVFRFRSLNFEDKAEIPLQEGYTRLGEEWFNYPLGVINYFLKDGRQIQGLDLLYYGDIPIGSGLSSSASIEVVTAYMLNEIFNGGYSKLDLVKLSKHVENNFIG